MNMSHFVFSWQSDIYQIILTFCYLLGKCKASAVEPAPAAPTLVIRTDALEKKPETKTKKRKESVVIEGTILSVYVVDDQI